MKGFIDLRRVAYGAAATAFVAMGPVADAKETKGPVTDDIGVLVIPKGAPIQIGGYWVLSGADTALGTDQKRAVEVAIKDVGGKLVGHPIKFNAEDSLCNAEGGQTAATKLAANPATAIVIGPSCSSEATPGAPIFWKAGITSIGTSPTAPSLTAPTRKPEYDGFVRTVYSDAMVEADDILGRLVKTLEETGQLENTMRIPQVKRDIARVKTILKETTLSKGK